uniref:Piwi domain-containing protein n=1 Tax=Caenorhabditis japonica TaxID=281687 RepID=A0A8R1DRX4_CAEJA
MTRTICALPFQHVQQTQRFLKDVLKIESSRVNPYLQAFKLSFPTNNPIRAKGRILAPPIIQFYKQNFIPDPRKSVRFSGKGKFIEPARIRSVAILNVDKGFRSVTKFAEQMERHCREQGITFEKPARDWKVVETHSEDTAGVKTFLSECLHKKVTIVVAIVNEKKPDIHDVLKYYEEKMGQQTIQICTDTAIKIMSEHGGKQTLENVLRKFNPKAGGTNFYLNIAPTVCGTSITPDATRLHEKLFARTQFIGFELSHTGARTQYDKQAELFDGEPTVVGVSYSLRQSTQLGGFSYFQPTREHKLSRLEEKFQICVDAYEKSAQSLPETIVVYRVGSGEGDFKRIFEEVNDMRKSAERTKQGYHPKFICILTQRHCHVRLFPERIQGRKAQEQNVPSGTVLETNVYRNGFDEFIMCCQTPMIPVDVGTYFEIYGWLF